MLDTTALPIAFAPELAARGMSGIRKAAYQEMGGSVLWTLHPTFDIRLAGNIAMPSGDFIDLGHLANCNPGGAGADVGSARCGGNDPALHAEARFRARFSGLIVSPSLLPLRPEREQQASVTISLRKKGGASRLVKV